MFNTIKTAISAAVSAFANAKQEKAQAQAQLVAQAAASLGDRKVGQRFSNQQATPRSIAAGDIGSDSVHTLSWQSQEAIINSGLWFATVKIAQGISKNQPLDVEEGVDNLRTWNYCAMNTTKAGNPKPNKDDKDLLALAAKVVAGQQQDATPLPDEILRVMARRAGKEFAEYQAEHVATVKAAAQSAATLLLKVEEEVVGHTDAMGCSEAYMPARTAIDKIDRQMNWMCKSWKDKKLVAAEIALMEDDIAMLEHTAIKDAGKVRKFEEGVLAADGLEVYEALKKSERELDSMQDVGYEPDALQVAFAEGAAEITQAEIVSNRKRVRRAA